MKRIFGRIIIGLFVCAGCIAVLVLFSTARTYHIEFARAQPSGTSTATQSSGRVVYLDATKFFGSNLTTLAAQVISSHIFQDNPQGPQKQNGTSTIQLKAGNASADALTGVYTQAQKDIPRYTASDLTLIDASKENVIAYLSAIKQISQTYLEPFRGKDIMMLALAAQKNDNANARKMLLDYTTASEQAITKLAQISVPKTWQDLHLGFLNILSESRTTALAFLTVHNDPIRANIMAQNYQALQKRFFYLNEAFSQNIQKTGLSF